MAPLASATRNTRLSALIAQRAVREAVAARGRGPLAVASVLASHQIANAQTSQTAVAEMLTEQGIHSSPEGTINPAAFTTQASSIEAMLQQAATDWQFKQLVESLVQDAGRSAESVSVASRSHIYHVRAVNPPCCSRCAILAGRVYRWSTGFQRHPGCDCTMIPTTVASPLLSTPADLFAQGKITGLSKADAQAVRDGADLSQVVNVQRKAAGLTESGHTLIRAGRPTPAGIYRQAGDDRAKAVELLKQHGYLI